MASPKPVGYPAPTGDSLLIAPAFTFTPSDLETLFERLRAGLEE